MMRDSAVSVHVPSVDVPSVVQQLSPDLTIVGAVVQAIAMAWFMSQTGTNNGAGGALIGLFVGLGFIAPAMFADVLFAGRPARLFAITAGYQVLAAVVQGAIIGFMGPGM